MAQGAYLQPALQAVHLDHRHRPSPESQGARTRGRCDRFREDENVSRAAAPQIAARRPRERGRMTGRVIPFDAAAYKVPDALLPWFVNGTLEGDELALVERHLGECLRCQHEVEWLRELHAACIAGEAMPGASAAFRNLRRQLEEPREGRDSIAGLRRSRGRARLWSRWAI